MDQHRTLTWARVFTFLPSRRDVLRGLAGAGFGLAALHSPDPGEVKRKRKRKKKKHCPPCKRRKKGKCKGTLRDGTPCGECLECRSGACVAKADGTPCPDGACQGGACKPPDDPCPGQKLCEGECIPTVKCCTTDDCSDGAAYICCNGLCTNEKLEPGSDCVHASECCSGYCRADRSFSLRTCSATCHGKQCTSEDDCCRGYPCESGRCGGCGDYEAICANDADCCFSDCPAPLGRCFSYPGGRCEKNMDCLSCGNYNNCSTTVNSVTRPICFDGVCLCPDVYECCADFHCDPNEFCDLDVTGIGGECIPLVGP